jgi:hypothetical protein
MSAFRIEEWIELREYFQITQNEINEAINKSIK